MEGSYALYCNTFGANPLAMNKNQQIEEKERRRYISRFFSISDESYDFKWDTIAYGELHLFGKCMN